MQLCLEVQADGELVFGLYSGGNALLKPDAELVEKVRCFLFMAIQYLESATKLPEGISPPPPGFVAVRLPAIRLPDITSFRDKS